MKYIKQAERNARANQVVTIVGKRIIQIEAVNDRDVYQHHKRKLNTKCIEVVIGKGRYFGDCKKVTAFVWMDDGSDVLRAA